MIAFISMHTFQFALTHRSDCTTTPIYPLESARLVRPCSDQTGSWRITLVGRRKRYVGVAPTHRSKRPIYPTSTGRSTSVRQSVISVVPIGTVQSRPPPLRLFQSPGRDGSTLPGVTTPGIDMSITIVKRFDSRRRRVGSGSVGWKKDPQRRTSAIAMNGAAEKSDTGKTQIHRRSGGIPKPDDLMRSWTFKTVLNAGHWMENGLHQRGASRFAILQSIESFGVLPDQ